MGDLHSSFHSLLHFIFDLHSKDFFKKDRLEIKDNHKIIFWEILLIEVLMV